MKKRTPTTLRFDGEEKRKLRILARKYGTSKTQIIRLLILAAYTQLQEQELDKKIRRKAK